MIYESLHVQLKILISHVFMIRNGPQRDHIDSMKITQ